MPSKIPIEFRRLASTFNQREVAQKFAEKIATIENPQRRFDYEHQRTIGLTTIPENAPKQTKELAESKPWLGDESLLETSKRLLEDSIKPLKISRSQRLSNARENVLDYTLNKNEGPTHKERLVSSKKRRYGGGASSGLSSGGWIESVAAQEIENAIANGQFKDIPRGKDALDVKEGLIYTSRNPQLDFTEYLMNNIIKKQGGAPPWIMKQQAVRQRIDQFREQIRQRLQERLVHRVVAVCGNDVVAATRLAHSGTHTHDEEWEKAYEAFHEEFVADINRQIRGYNLQAPSSARKGYLNAEDEIKRCYQTVTDGIDYAISKYVGALAVPKADKGTLHASTPPLESPEKHYGLKQLFRDLFKSRRNVNKL